ncbi:MAG: hypothetical protein JSS99_05350 [Actinobacteria bacterium]|nr:hypothetical protein [Actinomycetota bacterium]
MLAPVLGLLALAAALVAARRHRRAERAPGRVGKLGDDTTMGAEGAIRSVQAGELTLPASALEALWSPLQLERLARTYWRFLSRCTLGLIRVDYSATQRTVVLLRQPLRLLRFKAPEYAMDARRGTVRWRIEDGLLVQRRGHHGDGYLQIDVQRLSAAGEDPARIRVEVEVANFYASIAHRLSRPVYRVTQSRIHVLVTYGFLRSLARLDLAESRVGRLAGGLTVDDVPDPPLPPAEPDQP